MSITSAGDAFGKPCGPVAGRSRGTMYSKLCVNKHCKSNIMSAKCACSSMLRLCGQYAAIAVLFAISVLTSVRIKRGRLNLGIAKCIRTCYNPA